MNNNQPKAPLAVLIAVAVGAFTFLLSFGGMLLILKWMTQ